ncbi:hypothetical protein NQ314_020776 [Rhamnusium bicolor]|uniref:AP-3 complex subunit beta C-terminal domain-containing protein n=1 Tax=Rhamnusium bicolor TaxID=1586634 RepID=A0AAV8WK06_9CUCU|nr:hypothetical protein NQ314_020776 [Rhamnusium bicolor]
MLSSSSHNMSNNSSYSNDRGSSFEAEYAVDPASGGFFHTDFKKHDDLKEMLDSNKDSLKLEAMKRIIGMVAKGRDASILFPAVVKNVVSKNIEVKKLVYVYLERYAEEQQDLALLSISTFQRALKEPNQLIRAGALRVLSSVRVKMISPIVMLAIKDASSDMSPYVRKTAAHAIPKLYSLDPELKYELITIIQKLLADKTVLVIGSAVMAFTEVCPERVDLIHQVYRKLCALLVDVDEWGQVTIVNMLTRYARSQFVNPNLHEDDSDREFYDSNSDTSEKPAASLDPDHRLLLRSTRPLLQSRNAAVVMAVAQLYHHASPKSENPLAAKALVRLLRSHIEVQSVVLNAIASISAKNKGMFEPYLKSFFVRTSDPTNIKLLKLEILTNLTTDSNVSVILRELQTYISNSDKYFVAATIQAIGRCACSISEVTDSCLNGLVSLLSNRDEAVVAESVIVIKRLLQTQAADPKEIITHMARLLDSITVAQARAAILWLLGEHSQKVILYCIAPDILRKMAKTFSEEDKKGKDVFLWESEASSAADSSSSGSSSSESTSEASSGSEEESSEEESSEEEECEKKDYSSCEDSESSFDESSSEDNNTPVKKINSSQQDKTKVEKVSNNINSNVDNKKSNLDLLLDLCDINNEAPVMTPSLGGFFTPSTPIETPLTMQIVQSTFINTKSVELINRINGKGLSATYRFTRSPHLYSPSMTNNLAIGMSIHDFACISKLPPNCSLPATLGIDFNDTTQPANFEIVSSLGNFNVCIKPKVGELLRPVKMPTSLFIESSLDFVE